MLLCFFDLDFDMVLDLDLDLDLELDLDFGFGLLHTNHNQDEGREINSSIGCLIGRIPFRIWINACVV